MDEDNLPENYEETVEKTPFLGSSRLALAILGFFGFVNSYALLVNISVAIVCMVNRTAIQSNSSVQHQELEDECLRIPTGSNMSELGKIHDGQFEWDTKIQGYILGGFFWGYLVTQVPAGWIATRFGGKKVFGISMFIANICTLLTPVAARVSYIFLIILRIIIGMCNGTVFPAMHALWGNWAPPLERSKLTAFTYSGTQAGIVITFPLGAFLCQHGFGGGWPSIFYVCGISSFVWFIMWMMFVSDTPDSHRRISNEEKRYIMASLKEGSHRGPRKKLRVPWMQIAKSMPNYAIIVSNITSDWGAFTLLAYIPTYMNDVLKVDITENGLYSALPYVAFWAMINVGGWLADFVREKKLMSTTLTRKVFDAFGKIAPALMLIGLGYVDCSSPALAIVLLVLGVSLTGFQYSGFIVNHVDIAPFYAGILFGISNALASVAGFVSPVVVGEITEKAQTRSEWQIVFYIAAAVYIFGAIFYVIFASGDLQPWAAEEIENNDFNNENNDGRENHPLQPQNDTDEDKN